MQASTPKGQFRPAGGPPHSFRRDAMIAQPNKRQLYIYIHNIQALSQQKKGILPK